MREDWIECKAEEFGELIRGITYNKNQASDIPKDNYLPILRANNINNNRLNFNDIKYVDSKLIGDIQKIITNDIVIAMSSGSKHLVGKSAQTKVHYDGSFGAFCSVYRPNENVDGGYVSYFFQSSDFRRNISEISKGSNINNLKREHILEFVFPLAPLPIQRAIVSKIEALFSDLDNGIANFKIAQDQLKIYRQAVLKKAFEGELTKEWREKQTNLPTAEELIKKIKEERQNHYNLQIADWKKAVKVWQKNERESQRPIKPKKLAELPLLKDDVFSKLPLIPKSWIYNYLAYAGELGRGKSKHRPRNDKRLFGGNYPFFQTGDVKAQKLIRTYSQTYNEFGLKQSKLWKKGTLCITIAANIADTGFLGIDACFPDSIVGYNPYENVVSERFIEYFIQSAKSKISAFAPATAQKNINLNTLENLVIPFCSLEEQIQIVQEIESRLSVCDKVEQSIRESIEKAAVLRQSILKKAFDGNLLSQAEIEHCKQAKDYEPAKELLIKIQAEKMAKNQEKNKPTIKKKSKK